MSDRLEGCEELREDLQAERAARKELEERLDDMVAMQTFDAVIQGLRSRIDGNSEDIDDLTSDVSEIAAHVREIRTIHGQLSAPKQRVIDLRQILIGRAKHGSGRTKGRSSMKYGDVLDALADRGHGELDGKQAYNAMETLGGERGFQDTKSDGERVIRVDLNDVLHEEPVKDQGAIEIFNNGEEEVSR